MLNANLSCGGGRENQDMGGGDILRRRQLTFNGHLAESLIGRELVRHQPEGRVWLEGDQTRTEDTRHIVRIQQLTLTAYLLQVF